MQLVFKLRYPLFAVVLAAAALLFPYLGPAFKTNNSLEIWFFRSDPNLQAYYSSQKEFGNDEVIAIYFEPRGGILTRKNLELVRDISERIDGLEHIARVFSLTTVKDVVGREGGLFVEELIPGDDLSAEERQRILHKLRHKRILAGFYAGKQEKGVMITAQLVARRDIDAFRGEVNRQVLGIVEKALGKEGIKFQAGGTGIIYTEMNELTNDNVNKLIPLSYGVMFLLLLLLLWSFWGTVVTIVVVSLSTVITMGLFGYTGHRINMMTVVLPTLVIILSIADCVHVFVHVRSGLVDAREYRRFVIRALSFIAIPCLLTSVTTVVGFGSLVLTKMKVIREMGLFAAAGVVTAYLVTFATVPVFLGFIRLRPLEDRKGRLKLWLGAALARAARLSTTHPKRVVLVFTVLMVGMVATFPLINVDIHMFEYFPEGIRVRRDHEAIKAKYGQYLPLEFTIRTKKKDGVKNPAFLRKMQDFQARVEKMPDIGRSISVADMVAEIHRVLTGKSVLPDTRNAVAQELLLYSMSDPDELDRYITAKGDYTHLFFKMDFTSGNKARQMIERILTMGRGLFGRDADLRAVGYWPLYFKLVDYAFDVQVQSFALAFGLVFLVVFILFRDLKLTLLAIPANLFPVCVAGAILALGGIDLDFATATIAAILLGIAVDDTIHLVYRVKKERAAGRTRAEAVTAAITESGHALLTTTLILCAGFLVLLFSDIKTILTFGGLLTACLASALVADLLFLPAMICWGQAPPSKHSESNGV